MPYLGLSFCCGLDEKKQLYLKTSVGSNYKTEYDRITRNNNKREMYCLFYRKMKFQFNF